MAGIRGRDTKPEMEVRRALHRQGFRFRLHVRNLPGRPDIVLPKYKAVVLVHGCFWHGHDCRYFRLPTTRTAFWSGKIDDNRLRDERNCRDLLGAGWRVMVTWECALRDKQQSQRVATYERLCRWLKGSRKRGEIPG